MGTSRTSERSGIRSARLSRRDTLRQIGGGGIAAVTAVAGISTMAAATTSAAQEHASPSAALPRVQDECAFDRAAFDDRVEDIRIDTLHDFVATLVDAGGCPTCGLLGIDLRLRGGQPHPEMWRLNAPIFAELRPEERFEGVVDFVLAPQDPFPVAREEWEFGYVGVDVGFEEVSIEGIHDFVATLVDLAGCTRCGYNGLDSRFRGIRPQVDPWHLDAPIFGFQPDQFAGVMDYGTSGIAEIVPFPR